MRRWPSLVPTKRLSSKARMYSMVRGSLRSWWTRYAVCMTQAEGTDGYGGKGIAHCTSFCPGSSPDPSVSSRPRGGRGGTHWAWTRDTREGSASRHRDTPTLWSIWQLDKWHSDHDNPRVSSKHRQTRRLPFHSISIPFHSYYEWNQAISLLGLPVFTRYPWIVVTPIGYLLLRLNRRTFQKTRNLEMPNEYL